MKHAPMKHCYAHSDQAIDLCRAWLAGDPPWQLDRFLAQAMNRAFSVLKF